MTLLLAAESRPLTDVKVALVHDYLMQLGGAERVAGHLARLLPQADRFTSAHHQREAPPSLVGGSWQASFLQPLAIPAGMKPLLPLLPAAFARLPTRDYELVVSSSSAFGHHVRTGPGAVHVCYCCTPARFLWQPEDYFRGRPALRASLSLLLTYLRRLDVQAARRVDVYIAVSRHIARRIEATYQRPALTVYPPVECDRFAPSAQRSGRFLVVSRLVRSKRVDLVVEAANRHRLPLDVIGKGPELGRLQRLTGDTVRLLGWQPDEVVRRAMAESTAVVVAGEEDFGLVMAEAQAGGRPPVAFASGGALEIIEDGATGFLFDAQDPDAIAETMRRAEAQPLATADLLASARRFDLPVFRDTMLRTLGDILSEKRRAGVSGVEAWAS